MRTVKEEDWRGAEGAVSDWSRRSVAELNTEERRTRRREAAAKLAAEAGFGSCSRSDHSDLARLPAPLMTSLQRADENVNKHGGAHVKTPKYSGKADWDAFHAQFELLGHALGWSMEHKALQLAMCLTEDALSCLLLLSGDERQDYNALVGALSRRFGQCSAPGLLRSELCNRHRLPGEPLRTLANDIETLTRRAYAHMPASVQGELARDRFLQALSPADLRIQTQLAHPTTLQEALEMAGERELLGMGMTGRSQDFTAPRVRTAEGGGMGSERPVWVGEITELIRATALQSGQPTQPRARLCWGCGKPGHLVRECPNRRRDQGNGPGSA